MRIDAKCIWWDESLSLIRAQSSFSTILSGRISFGGIDSTDQHPPLYFLTLSAATAVLGSSDLALRLASALATVAAVAVVFVLARRLYGGRVACVSAFLVAVSPLLIWYGQEARMYALATLLSLLTLYACWRSLTERSLAFMGAAVGALAAAAGTHYLTILFTVPCTVVACGILGRRAGQLPVAQRADARARVRLVAALLSTTAIVLVVGLVLCRRAAESSLDIAPLSLPEMMVDALNSFSLGLSVKLREVWWIDAVFAAFWLVGICTVLVPAIHQRTLRLRSRVARVWLLVTGVLAPVFIAWLISRWEPFYTNSRYVMFSAPLFDIGVAIGLAGAKRHTWPRAVFAAGLLCALGWSLTRYYSDPYYASKENYAKAASHVMARELPGDLLIINGPENDAAFLHYYRGRLDTVSLPNAQVPAGDVGKTLRHLLANHERVWVVSARRAFSDPDGHVRRWFDQHTLPELTRSFESSGALISVNLYLRDDPTSVVESSTAQVLARVGPAVLAEARGLTSLSTMEWSSQVPQPVMRVASGEALGARLTWVLESPTPELKLSLRLVREGIVWAQNDIRPVDRHPSSEWPLRAPVTHTAWLVTPRGLPPAIYELQIWAYDGQTGQSWPFVSQDVETGYLGFLVEVQPPDRVGPPWRPPVKAALAPRWGLPGQAVTLDDLDRMPEQTPPGAPVTIGWNWRWKNIDPSDMQVYLQWQSNDGHVYPAGSSPLLGAGEVAASVQAMGAVTTRTVALAPAPPGEYTLHLMVYDTERNRFLWMRRGMLPSFSKDLVLGTVSVRP